MASKFARRDVTFRRDPMKLTLAIAAYAFAVSTPLLATGSPANGWGGPDCSSRAVLRQVVDEAFAAAPAAEASGSGRGSGAAGYSVALSKTGCGTFRYTVGVRDFERGKAMTPHTRHHLGSLTKALTAAMILRLDAFGGFGPNGLETPVSEFLSAEDIAALSFGPDSTQPLCPAEFLTPDRLTGEPRLVEGLCPDFSLINLRQLLNGNHGLFDFLNEVDRNSNGILDSDEYALGALFGVLGVPTLTLPEGTDSAFDLLVAYGVLANPEAVIGGTRLEDFEASFGNTGYNLLGVIAERVTGLSYSRLLRLLIGVPLRVGVRALNAPPDPENQISRQYLVTTGAEDVGLPEDLFGLYPQVEIAGNPAVNVYDLDAFVVTGGGGGAGAAVMAPRGYRRFFKALIGGSLLSPGAQSLFDTGFVPIDGLPGVSHGFGVFQFDDPELGPAYAKSGRVTGSGCQLLHFIDPGTTVVVCRNSADAFLGGSVPPSSTPVGDLARELARSAMP